MAGFSWLERTPAMGIIADADGGPPFADGGSAFRWHRTRAGPPHYYCPRVYCPRSFNGTRLEEEIVHLHVDRIVDSHADDPPIFSVRVNESRRSQNAGRAVATATFTTYTAVGAT